jgi:hypothetical protein
MTDSPSPNTFIPQPLSIHTFDEEAFRKWSRRPIIVLGRWALLIPVGTFVMVISSAVRYPKKLIVLWLVPACCAALAVLSALAFFAKPRWERRLWGATRVEVWPDCVIRRIEGRPPLVIRYEEVASVRRNPDGLMIRKVGDPFNPMFVPVFFWGLDELHAHILGRQGSWSCRGLPLWRDPRFLIPAFGPVVGFYACIPVENPWIATLGAALAVVTSSLFARSIWRGQHRDKWTLRIVWAYPAAVLAIFVPAVADKWLRLYGWSLMELLRAMQ